MFLLLPPWGKVGKGVLFLNIRTLASIMSFKLFSVSSVYPGNLEAFYDKHPEVRQFTYEDHLKLLLNETTEFVGSYIRNFRKQGLDAVCAIANDNTLQKKWVQENNSDRKVDKDTLFEQVKAYNPEILWIENLSYTSKEWLIRVRKDIKSIKLIVAYHCAPFNSKILESLTSVDFVITCTPGLKMMIENKGKKAYLVYHGFDSDLLPGNSESTGSYTDDFIFSGSLISGGNFHNNRIKLIERILEENIDISLYVNLENRLKIRAKQSIYLLASLMKKLKMDAVVKNLKILEYGKTKVNMYSHSLITRKRPPVYGADMYKLFSQSKVVLNYHIGVAGDYAGNMRMFEVTGCGSCLLTDNKKNMGDLFDTNTEVVVYDSIEDCISKIKWLLDHEDERREIALSGQKRTLSFHTVEKRCETIIEILNRELKFSGKTE
jgi:spore maturation protein CgeB